MSGDSMIPQNYPAARAMASTQPNDSTRSYHLFGLALIIILIGGVGFWSATAKLGGAVIAPATFTVESNRKMINHYDGGVVRDILVREGDRVSAGDVLVRLDSTIAGVNLEVVDKQLWESIALRTRLLAEQQGADILDIPNDLADRMDNPAVQAIVESQRLLFAARQTSRNGERRLIEQRIARFGEEITGLENQRAATDRQIDLAEQELVDLRELLDLGLTRRSRVLELERQAEQTRATSAGLTADIAEARNGIDELHLEIVQSERKLREEVTAELRTTGQRIAILEEQRVAAAQQLKQNDVLAPEDGTVVDLKVHTVGAAIRPGDPILDLVPEDDPLLLRAMVSVDDIDKIKVGQKARVRLTAFDQVTTPEVVGEVLSVTADTLIDDRTGHKFYVAMVRLADEQPSGIHDLELVPGMRAEVFVQTGSRTAFSYLVGPLRDRLARSFAEG